MNDANEDELESQPDRSPWIICPTCNGDGHHARHLGSFTQSEFEDCFDDEESRQGYFNGDYDKCCEVCEGTGKIRESQWEKHAEATRRYRELERGYNDAGEPLY